MRFKQTSLLIVLALTSCSSLSNLTGFGRYSNNITKPVYHTVRSGDTLRVISSDYGVSEKTIAFLNGVHDLSRIRVGQRLLVSYGNPVSQRGSLILGSAIPAKYSPSQEYSRRVIWPVRKGKISSYFGPRGRSFHDGIDIAAPTGTAVYAAHSGVVAYSDNGVRGYGKMVIIRSKTGLTTVYGHNSRLLVDEGQHVRQGQVIAKVGSTGRSSGPHLHFEIRRKDRKGRYVSVDPIPVLSNSDQQFKKYRVNNNLTPILARLRN